MLPKAPNFRSKNSLKNQINSKTKTYKFLFYKQGLFNIKFYKYLIKNLYFSNSYDVNSVPLKNQNTLYTKSYKNLIAKQYFYNFKNINFDNYLSSNKVKNLANIHFSNLTNINLKSKPIKSYYKNLHYNLIKLQHTLSGLFPVYCRKII